MYNKNIRAETGKVYFGYDDDIINPCWDNVFKAIFTKDTEESRGALIKLLSAIIGQELTVVMITANEPPIDNLRDKQIRYDINCKFDEGNLANVEMTLYPDAYEPVRLEYYASKLFVSQDIRGKDNSYKKLKHTYQISFLVNTPIFKDENFVHRFDYYDENLKTSLNGLTHIITVELSKLDQVAQKRVYDMTPQERWAVFFKYSTHKDKRQLINQILECEEGIAMAGHTLLTISKEESEYFRKMSEYKYEVDLQSKIVDAKSIGHQKGRQVGLKEGEHRKAIEIAKKLLAMNLDVEQIAETTGLSAGEIIKLKTQ